MAVQLFQENTFAGSQLLPKPGLFGDISSMQVLILEPFTFRGRERCDVVPLERQCDGAFVANLEAIRTVWVSEK